MSLGGFQIDLVDIQPSEGNCLAWSEDGVLAVAGGEFVVILGERSSASHP